MNTITGGNGPSCSGCVTNVGIRPALVEISTMRSFIALHLVPPRSMLELAEQQLAGHFPVRLGHKITPISREERVAFAVQAAACFAGIRPRCTKHTRRGGSKIMAQRGPRCAPNAPAADPWRGCLG